MQNPPLENVLIPVLITAVVNLAVFLGGQFFASRKDRVTLQSAEAQQLNADRALLRKEFVDDNERLRKEVSDLREEVAHCDRERDSLADQVHEQARQLTAQAAEMLGLQRQLNELKGA